MRRKPSLIIDDYVECLIKCKSCDRKPTKAGFGWLSWYRNPCNTCVVRKEKEKLESEWSWNKDWLILKAKEKIRLYE